ncbi:hypothetical protein CHU00_13940 [Sphingobacterium cellulitidis]|uniref:hypothetical protein n=1 Tax=Sphingobacterium cellulitidis TaxID=1768011 RepID=UPI000B9402AE|nr:hypothetical protein [Sphingobacterium cellulitidis]OYD44956.1 hypothetical protein CHU00_13940 [Sphingobacterium cellulitidis]
MPNKNVVNNPVLFCLILCFIVWVIYFVITKKNTLYLLKQNYALEIESDYRGVIKKIYNDKSNHNSSMVEFMYGDVIGINGAFVSQMEVGDSISKVKGDSVIMVFRKGKYFSIGMNSFYRKAIQKEIK